MTVTLAQLSLFAAAVLVMVASPGPFVAAVAARSAALGLHPAAAMILGGSAAEAVWIAAAVLGLGVIAATHAGALVVLKYLGAAWLMWIGYRLLTQRHSLAAPEGRKPREGLARAALSGALLNLGNPKAALFYMALFPGFFDVAHLTAWDCLAILATALPIGAGSDMLYALAANRARRLFTDSRAARRIDKVSGGVLCGAGAAIALN